MKLYYYADNDQHKGPFTIEELKTKRLNRKTLVWTDGMEDWATAEGIGELHEILISEPPPLPKKNNSSLKNELILEKDHPIIGRNSKFDHAYIKETEATFIGIVILAIPILFNVTGIIKFDSEESFNQAKTLILLTTLAIRIGSTVWVRNIATRQNRNATGWGWFAFFLPSIALIIIGQLKKLKLKIELNENLRPSEQTIVLLQKAKVLFNNYRFAECIQLLDKAIELEPNNLKCIELRALSNFKLNNYGIAEQDFKLLLNHEKYFLISNLHLGNIASINHNQDKAIEFWLAAKKHNNVDAEKKLDMFYNFTHKYLLNNTQLHRKLGIEEERPFMEYGVSKYINGLPIIDQELKPKSNKVKIGQYQNGICLEFRSTFKSINLAIAYYEIADIKYYKVERIFEVLLTDRNILKFSYDLSKDYLKGLDKLSDNFKRATGRNLTQLQYEIE